MTDLCIVLGFCHHVGIKGRWTKPFEDLSKCDCGKPNAAHFLADTRAFKKDFRSSNRTLADDLAVDPHPDEEAFQEMTESFFQANHHLGDTYWSSVASSVSSQCLTTSK